MKRRKMLAILFLLVVSTLGWFFFRLYKQARHLSVDLSKLATFNDCIAELAETMIPETDAFPGAKSAGVGATVLLLVEHCLEKSEQAIFLKGLADLDADCKRKFGRVFARCTESERLETLHRMEADAMFGGWFITKVRHRLFGKPFITLAKDLCVHAFCTSMQGAMNALAYDPVPGCYNGCLVLSEKQRSWALV